MTHAEIAATVKVTAELMGGKCPSEDAMTVLCNRLREQPENVIKATLKWLGENESGHLTLQKLMKALGSAATVVTQTQATCCANGCPMLATINSDGGWHCRYHVQERRGIKADLITQVLRRNGDKLDAIHKLSNAPGRKAWMAQLELMGQVQSEINKLVDDNAQRIKDEAEKAHKQSNVMEMMGPMLKRWGIAA